MVQIRKDDTARTSRYWFDSLNELSRWIDATRPTWTGCNSSAKKSPGLHWDLGASYKDALGMARNGWLEGAATVSKALKAFPPQSVGPDTAPGFYGFKPHIGRYCAGVPNHMVRHLPKEGQGPVLTLVVACNALGSVDARYMSNMGVAIAQYINQMETQGTRVEIIGCITSSVSGYRLSHAWRIKYSDQPLDLAVLSFAIGHPAMFRRLGFALRERSNVARDYSYGSSTSSHTDDIVNVPPGAVVLNGMVNADKYARTPEAALDYVTKQIDAAIADRNAAAL